MVYNTVVCQLILQQSEVIICLFYCQRWFPNVRNICVLLDNIEKIGSNQFEISIKVLWDYLHILLLICKMIIGEVFSVNYTLIFSLYI